MMIPTALGSAWQRRTPRERRLLTALAALLAALAFWHGVVLPLRQAATAASLKVGAAAQRLAEVESALRLRERMQGMAPLADGDLEAAVTASALASGIAIENLRNEQPGEITVSANGIESGAFFAWLRTLERAHGVRPVDVTLARDETGLLTVEVRLAGALQ